MRMGPWTKLLIPMGLMHSATFVTLGWKGQEQELLTYDGRQSLITLWRGVSSHNIVSRTLTPLWVCVGHVYHIVRENTGLFCHLGLGELLSPVVGRSRWWQGNGQIGDKIWAKEFSEKNVSCLTCLSQLKCLHLKQNYSIVNHNELQSLTSLPARHKKRKEIEGANSLRKFGVAQII